MSSRKMTNSQKRPRCLMMIALLFTYLEDPGLSILDVQIKGHLSHHFVNKKPSYLRKGDIFWVCCITDLVTSGGDWLMIPVVPIITTLRCLRDQHHSEWMMSPKWKGVWQGMARVCRYYNRQLCLSNINAKLH